MQPRQQTAPTPAEQTYPVGTRAQNDRGEIVRLGADGQWHPVLRAQRPKGDIVELGEDNQWHPAPASAQAPATAPQAAPPSLKRLPDPDILARFDAAAPLAPRPSGPGDSALAKRGKVAIEGGLVFFLASCAAFLWHRLTAFAVPLVRREPEPDAGAKSEEANDHGQPGPNQRDQVPPGHGTRGDGVTSLAKTPPPSPTRPMWKPHLTTQERRAMAAKLRRLAEDPSLTPEQKAEKLRAAKNLEVLAKRRELQDAKPEGTA